MSTRHFRFVETISAPAVALDDPILLEIMNEYDESLVRMCAYHCWRAVAYNLATLAGCAHSHCPGCKVRLRRVFREIYAVLHCQLYKFAAMLRLLDVSSVDHGAHLRT